MMRTRTRILAACLAASCAAGAFAGEGLSQRELAERLLAKVEAGNIKTDEAGNVVLLALSNHGIHRKDKQASAAPGVRDEELTEAVGKMPRLRTVFLEKQPVTNAGYRVLAGLPELIDLRLHCINDKLFRDREGYDYPLADANAALVVNELKRPLKVLELKHCFAVKDVSIHLLTPQPELEKLELDTTFSGPEAVKFILGSPKVRNLQLHRTTMSDADLVRVLEALPALEVLEIRPRRPKDRKAAPITSRSLRGLRGHRKLRAIYMGIRWPELAWEGGLEHLAGIRSLEVVDLHNAEPDVKKDHPAVRKLHDARPDLTIVVKGGTIEGTGELKKFPRDEHYRSGVMR